MLETVAQKQWGGSQGQTLRECGEVYTGDQECSEFVSRELLVERQLKDTYFILGSY